MVRQFGVLPEVDGLQLLRLVPAVLQPPVDPGRGAGLCLAGQAHAPHPLLQHRLVNSRDTHHRLV